MGLKIIIIFLLIIGINYTGFCKEKKVRTVILFYSYNSGLVTYQNINEGFYNTYKNSSVKTFIIFSGYLDIGRTTNNEYGKSVVNINNKKF